MLYKITGFISIFGPVLFLLTFLILGFVQPEYHHLDHTISMLVNGPYGWVQNVNFFILAVSFASLGLGLGRHIYGKLINFISVSFFLLSLGVIALIIFPAELVPGDTNVVLGTVGKLHFLSSMVASLFAAVSIFFVLKTFKAHEYWSKLVKLTKIILIFNTVFIIVWFGLSFYLGLTFPLKGIMQKVLVGNVLGWMIMVGWKLTKATD